MDDNKKFAQNRSKEFAVRIVNLVRYLNNEQHEYVMSNQILRSGTSIGANITEAEYAQSRADFFSKVSISLKEAAETRYWLDLLFRTKYLNDEQYQSLLTDVEALIKILVKTVKKKEEV